MSTTATITHRAAPAAAAVSPAAGRSSGGLAPVGAKSRDELFPSIVGQSREITFWRFLGISGKNPAPTWSMVFYAMFMEMMGSWLLGTGVALAAWGVTGNTSTGLLNGVLLGIVYGLTYYVGTRWYKDHVLRRHLSGAITFGYLFTNDIGLGGALFYTISQYLGGLLAMGTVAGILSGATDALPRTTVPIATTLTSSLGTVVCLELFAGAIVVFTLLLNEFLNTDGTTEEAMIKNFKRASKTVAFTIVIMVALFSQFGVFTFNNVAYQGGLFGGVNAATAWRETSNLAQLSNTTLYPNTVFVNGGAWALFMLMPYLAGILGAALFWAVFMLRVDNPNITNEVFQRKRLYNEGAPYTTRDELNEPLMASAYKSQ